MVPWIGSLDEQVQLSMLPDYDPTAWQVGLSRGELKELSKVGGLPVIYGTRKVNGITVYLEQRKGQLLLDGSYHKGGTWQQSFALSEGTISSVSYVYIDDNHGTTCTYSQSFDRQQATTPDWILSIKQFLGADDQVANHNFSDQNSFTYENDDSSKPNTSWSAEHKLSGVAHVDVTFQPTLNSGNTGEKRLPKLQFKVTGVAGGTSNPALILKDYLTNTRYGCSIPADEIDDTSFSSAQTYCDVAVDSGAGYSKRHECNIVLDTNKTLIENIKIILSSCNGQLHWIGGKYKLHIDQEQTGSNVFDFDESHIIGNIKVIGEKKSERANQVTCKYSRKYGRPIEGTVLRDDFRSDEISWPDTSSSTYSTYLSEDNNIPLKKEISLQSVTDYQQARFLAQQACLLSRNSMGVEFTATAEALEVVVGDIISVTHSTPAWTQKQFIVRSLTINPNGTVNLKGTEYQAGTYIWDQANAPAEIPDTNLPNINNIESPSDLRWVESTYSAIASAGLRVQIQLSWVHNQQFELTSEYEFEYKKSTATDWTAGGTSTSKSGIINDFEKGFHDFRVRAVSSIGTRSEWFTLSNQNIKGSIYPPQDVTGFGVSNHGSSVIVSWDEPTDATDVDHVAIGVLQDGSTSWNDAIIVGKVGKGNTSVVLPAMEGNYVAKFINSSGKESEAYVASGEVPSYNTQKVETFAEQQAWTGTMDGFYKTTITSGGTTKDVLRFLGGALFDSVTEEIDAWYTIDGLGGRTDPAIYTGLKRDLGAVVPCRISTDTIFTAEVTDGTNYMAYWGKVDLRSTWDDELRMNALNFEVRTTDDDPASGSATWSAWKPFIIIDTVTRGLQMRASFDEFDENSQLTLSELELIVEMVARHESDRAKTATSITYDTPFYTVPDLCVTPVNMATGDYMTISSEAKTGFGINFYNSSGASQTRTYNYIARGV